MRQSQYLALSLVLLFAVNVSFALQWFETAPDFYIPVNKQVAPNDPVGGDVWPVAIFWIEIQVGTPPKVFPVAIDSGSSTLDIPFVDCDSCIKAPPNNQYDPTDSSTSTTVSCDSSFGCDSCNNGQCEFSNSYETCDLTNPIAVCTIDGYYYFDMVSVYFGPVNVSFGAITFQTKNFDQFQNVDGVLGLAGSASDGNVFAALVDAGKIKQDVFAMCFNEGAISNGTMTVGGVDPTLYTGDIQYVPNVGFGYNMKLHGIQVFGKTVKGTTTTAILDSGTNVLLISDGSFADMKSTFIKQCSTTPLPGICDVSSNSTLFDNKCFSLTPSQIALFPPIKFSLDQGVTLQITGNDYLNLQDPLDPSKYCLGIRPTGPGGFLIIGDTIMQEYYVVFDRERNQIGWAPVNKKNCGSIPIPPSPFRV